MEFVSSNVRKAMSHVNGGLVGLDKDTFIRHLQTKLEETLTIHYMMVDQLIYENGKGYEYYKLCEKLRFSLSRCEEDRRQLMGVVESVRGKNVGLMRRMDETGESVHKPVGTREDGRDARTASIVAPESGSPHDDARARIPGVRLMESMPFINVRNLKDRLFGSRSPVLKTAKTLSDAGSQTEPPSAGRTRVAFTQTAAAVYARTATQTTAAVYARTATQTAAAVHWTVASQTDPTTGDAVAVQTDPPTRDTGTTAAQTDPTAYSVTAVQTDAAAYSATAVQTDVVQTETATLTYNTFSQTDRTASGTVAVQTDRTASGTVAVQTDPEPRDRDGNVTRCAAVASVRVQTDEPRRNGGWDAVGELSDKFGCGDHNVAESNNRRPNLKSVLKKVELNGFQALCFQELLFVHRKIIDNSVVLCKKYTSLIEVAVKHLPSWQRGSIKQKHDIIHIFATLDEVMAVKNRQVESYKIDLASEIQKRTDIEKRYDTSNGLLSETNVNYERLVADNKTPAPRSDHGESNRRDDIEKFIRQCSGSRFTYDEIIAGKFAKCLENDDDRREIKLT